MGRSATLQELTLGPLTTLARKLLHQGRSLKGPEDAIQSIIV
jgi:hypothetical protein